MPLLDQIQKDMTAAMKGREEARLDAIRMIKAALQRYTIDTGKPLDEAAELQILMRRPARVYDVSGVGTAVTKG